MNYEVAQLYPNSKNNTITVKLVFVNRKFEGSLQGDWKIVKNNKIVEEFEVVDKETYSQMYIKYVNLITELELTGIDGTVVNLDKY